MSRIATPEDWQAHLSALSACRQCPHVQPEPVVGPVPGARIFLMAQAPGPRERDQGRPFVWTAGRTLFKWFAALGVSEEEFRAKIYMGAVIRCFPGKMPPRKDARSGKVASPGDRKPGRIEVENCRPFYEREFALLRPQLALLVGKLAIDQFFGPSRLDDVVGAAHTLELNGHVFTGVPLPHPSGLNRWLQSDHGKALLDQALRRVAEHPAWRETFGAPIL